MAHMSQRPDQQTGTGAARSAPHPSEAERAGDPLRPPDAHEAIDDINRSGSGGSGGPSEHDGQSESQQPPSIEDLLAGCP
jgi:hypothetical protein